MCQALTSRGDIIETWKYPHGQYHFSQMPLQRVYKHHHTRGHSMKSSEEGGVSSTSEETSSDIPW